MISVVIGSAVVARPARAGRGRGAAVPERGRRERRVFGREARGMRCGYLEARGVTSANRTARDSLPPRPKPRQRHLVAHLVEHHLDRHPDPQLLVCIPDDVRVQADALLQLDDHDVVGHVLEEGGVLGAVHDDEGVDRAASREPDPLAALGEAAGAEDARRPAEVPADRKSTRLNSSHRCISYAVFCLKKKITPIARHVSYPIAVQHEPLFVATAYLTLFPVYYALLLIPILLTMIHVWAPLITTHDVST